VVLLSTSCAPSPEPAELRREIAQRVDTAPVHADPYAEAMKPMLGYWMTDLDATLRENAPLPAQARDAIREQLVVNPFELHITEEYYVSRGPIKTIKDRYTVTSVDGSMVTLKLIAVDYVADHDREALLRVRDGHLLIYAGEMTCVFSRKVGN
jgi:hypothetical protein